MKVLEIKFNFIIEHIKEHAGTYEYLEYTIFHMTTEALQIIIDKM